MKRNQGEISQKVWSKFIEYLDSSGVEWEDGLGHLTKDEVMAACMKHMDQFSLHQRECEDINSKLHFEIEELKNSKESY